MKKLLFLLSICSFTAASAQQNDLFDIQKHLLKKSTEENNVKMELNTSNLIFYFKNKNTGVDYSNPGNNKIIILPLDNMPCVIPDMKQFQSMPNAGLKTILDNMMAGKIPNPAEPLKIEALKEKSSK